MTTPIDPGDTGAGDGGRGMSEPIDTNDAKEIERAYWAGREAFISQHPGVWTGSQADDAGTIAAARAVCPDGYVIVRRDDLRDVLALVDYRRFAAGDAALVDRLRVAIGDEG